MNDSLKIALNGFFEIRKVTHLFNDEKVKTGNMSGPEIIWSPYDSTEIVIGATLIDGDAGTTFNAFSAFDEAYLRASATF